MVTEDCEPAFPPVSIGLHFYDMKNHAICVIFFCISTFYLSYFKIFICVLHSILSFAKYKFSFVKYYRASFVKIIYPTLLRYIECFRDSITLNSF